MLARIQKAAVITSVIFVAVWIATAFALDRAAWAAVGMLVPVALYVGTIATEFYFLSRSFAQHDPLRPRFTQLARAYLREILSTPRIFLWWQPFRSGAEADHIAPSSKRSRAGVLLVHGFVCNRGIWTIWMRRLRVAGVPYIAVNLEPVFGSIDHYVPTIDRAIAALTEATGRPPVIVSHSMGGLAARAWLAQATGATACHALVTVGTPHRGTWTARHSRAANAREMRIGSAWLERLAAVERLRPPQRTLCFWSNCDNIVFPSINATLPGADNRHLEGAPHVQMVHHPEVYAAVLKLVDEPTSKHADG